jgi:phosphoribosylpyrophosphate synthetase
MAPGALERICAAGVRSVVTTDSVPAAADPRLERLSIAPLLAQALRD